MNAPETAVGKPLNRVDGRLKVTGSAKYAAEPKAERLAHAVLVVSTIARGSIAEIDTVSAEKAVGVLAVLTHRNAGKLQPQMPQERPPVDPSVGEAHSPLQNDRIHFAGQPIALVVADSLERAQYAASLVKTSYREQPAVVTFSAAARNAAAPSEPKNEKAQSKKPDYSRGDAAKALGEAAVRIEETYTIPAEYHNPMELHATIAMWAGPELTLYDKTQWVGNVQDQVARALNMRREDVRVISPFVGGAFGAGLRVWPHTLLAALAARHVRRPVKLVVSRAHMYTLTGYRPHTVQKVALGAMRNGALTAIRHEGTAQTSTYEEYTESLLNATRYFYACPNVATRYRLAAMNVNTPTPMRGPGEASGLFALECAMDELAAALNMDPLELRLRNHADADPQSGQPWSSKSLKECYREGAARIGWEKRNPKPRSMHDGRWLIGYGMASATWPSNRMPATVLVRLQRDGTALVRTASSDIGPGTYTVVTQIAADALGLPPGKVRFELGDTRFPTAPVQGGSMTVASVGSAVHEVAQAARQCLIALARGDRRSPLFEAAAEDILCNNGRLSRKSNPDRGESFADLLSRHQPVEVSQELKPGKENEKFSMHAFGAHFVDLRVDAELGMVRLARVVSRFAAGKIINPKTAHSQAIGGVVGGIGMALFEEAIRDTRNARVVNSNLADYLMPVHADIPDLDAAFIEETDRHVNPLGAKGLAELSLVGIAAAIANAVYHATGRRIRDLPITIDKLL